MKISLDKNNADSSIRSYTVGSIRINEQTYTKPLIITPTSITEWPVNSVDQLTAPDFQPVIDKQAEIIILGTGNKQIFPPAAILQLAAEKHIGLEVMDTAAACRTYNVLLSENRSICGALFMIGA